MHTQHCCKLLFNSHHRSYNCAARSSAAAECCKSLQYNSDRKTMVVLVIALQLTGDYFIVTDDNDWFWWVRVPEYKSPSYLSESPEY